MSLSPKSTGINFNTKSVAALANKANRQSTLRRTTSYTQCDLSHFAYEPGILIQGVLVVRNFNHDSN